MGELDPALRARTDAFVADLLDLVRRQALETTLDTVFQRIEAGPGQRADQIARALRVPARALVVPLRKLLARGRITSRGQKSATRYYPR